MNEFCIFDKQKKHYMIKNKIYEIPNDVQLSKEEKSEFSLLNFKEKNYINETTNYTMYTVYDLNKFDFNTIETEHPTFLEFFDCYIYIPKNNNICAKCLRKRYLEGMHTDFRVLTEKPIQHCYINFKHTLNDVEINALLGRNNKKLVVFDKYLNITFYCNFECIHGCEVRKKNTKKERLYLDTYTETDNGYRVTTINLLDYVSRISPVNSVLELTNNDKVNIPVFGATSSCSFDEIGFECHGGKGFKEKDALNSAIAESMERYSARRFGNEIETVSSVLMLRDKKINFLDPKFLRPDGTDTCTYKEDKLYKWILGVDYGEKEKILIPSNVVYFPYHDKEKYHFISQSTTGLSVGSSLNEAILQGIFEILERNSYSLTHKAQLSVKNINIMNEETLIRIQQLTEANIYAHFTLLSNSYGVYIVHCTLEDGAGNFPIYTHGSGASLDIKTSINRSLSESIQMRNSQIISENLSELEMTNEEKASYNWGIGNTEYCNIFLNSISNESVDEYDLLPKNTGSLKTDINTIFKELKKENQKLLFVDLSREDLPLNAVRVIITGMQDIDNNNTRPSKKLMEMGISNDLPLFS